MDYPLPLSLFLLYFVSNLQSLSLLFTAALQDVLSCLKKLVHGVFVTDDVNVKGSLHLELRHSHIGLQT